MSDQLPAPRPPQRRLHPALMVLLILVGIILLLPGLCSLAAMVILSSMGMSGGLLLLWVFCFAVSAGGIWLIRYAVRRDRGPEVDLGLRRLSDAQEYLAPV